MNHTFTRFLGVTALCLALSACAAHNDISAGNPLDTLQGHKGRSEQRLATVASHAMAEGRTAEALTTYERLYKRSKARDVSLNYAQLLRKTGDTKKALKILAPLANSGGNAAVPQALARNEYAAALIQDGQFQQAEKVLGTVLTSQDTRDFHPDASHLMGVAIDAQGHHQQAEPYFRQALDGWQGDKTSVMNNLALNLASQGKFDESLTLLRRAQLMAPEKTEIARNTAIVTSLRDAVVPKAPVSVRKKAPAKKK